MTISNTLLAKLKDTSLITDNALIAGEWRGTSDTGKCFEVTNPSTGEVIAILPDMGRTEAAHAIDAAYLPKRPGRRKLARSALPCCASSMTSWWLMLTISPPS
jgi:succinate-semialdehyde dehydrogenase / glutarate-semialdehyde dehydrogenase